MRKSYLLLISLIMLFSFTGCKKKQGQFKTLEQIREDVNSFDVIMDYNGIVFELIKTSQGYYYAFDEKKLAIYYDQKTNQSYQIDNSQKQKLLLMDNYDFSDPLEDVYYVLTRHLSDPKIAYFKTRKSTYLNRDITEYYDEKNNLKQYYYLDDETGACLYFHIVNDSSDIVCKVNQFKLGNNFLDQFATYTAVETANKANLKSTTEVRKHFTTYDLTIKYNKQNIHLIKDQQGLFLSTDSNDQTLLYSITEDKWYTVDLVNQTRSLYETNGNDPSALEQQILDLITNYQANIDENFYEIKNQTYLDYQDVSLYTKRFLIKNDLYMQNYLIDNQTGICLSIEISNPTASISLNIIDFKQVGDVSLYLNYPVKKLPYTSWPKDHPYLEVLEEIRGGSFYVAYEDNDNLIIEYRNFTSSLFDQALNQFKRAGFTNDVSENKDVQSGGRIYTYYIYNATSSNGLMLKMEYYSDGVFRITLGYSL